MLALGRSFCSTRRIILVSFVLRKGMFFGSITTGAQDDLQRVTKMAYAIVSSYGMDGQVGHLSYYLNAEERTQQFQKPFSEATSNQIDARVKAMVDEAYGRTKALLEEKREQVEIVSQHLLEKEVLGKKCVTPD